MAVSEAVRQYYVQRIVARTTREAPPPNFRPLDDEPTGRATVEGCRGGGKNVLEVTIRGADGHVQDVRVACGLCNPAMYAAADLVAEWARGRSLDEIRALDVLDREALAPFFESLGGPGRPEDFREKVQYALLALGHAVRDHCGEDPPPDPEIPEPGTEED